MSLLHSRIIYVFFLDITCAENHIFFIFFFITIKLVVTLQCHQNILKCRFLLKNCCHHNKHLEGVQTLRLRTQGLCNIMGNLPIQAVHSYLYSYKQEYKCLEACDKKFLLVQFSLSSPILINATYLRPGGGLYCLAFSNIDLEKILKRVMETKILPKQ